MADQPADPHTTDPAVHAAEAASQRPALEAGDNLTGHNYDGIQEYDNPTPGWWNWLFIGTIVFSFCYLFIMLVRDDVSVAATYERAFAANVVRQFGEIGDLEPTRETLLRFAFNEDDAKWRAVGASVFAAQCVSCHGRNAEGQQGPNLTDNAFKNVKTLEDIADVVIHGANNGAMPAWGNRLHPNEVVLVSAYVASLRGTDAPGGKAPEGGAIPTWRE